MNDPRSPRTPRTVTSAGAAIVAASVCGCQTYRPSNLDLHAHRLLWEQRLEDQENLAAFAQRRCASAHGAPVHFDLADGVSEPEGEILALLYNADLRLARLDAGIARATLETAGLWEDPEFGFDGAEILSPAAPFEFGLTMSLTIPVSGRLAVERARAGAAHEAELRRIVDMEWEVRMSVRRAWGAWAAAEARRDLLGDVAARVARVGAITDHLEEAGELTRVEGRLLRIELAARRAELIAAESDARQTRARLLGSMGLPPGVAIALDPTIPPIPEPVAERTPDRLISHNTALAVRRAEYQVAEETLRLEVRRQYPDITFGTGYGSEDRDDRLLLGVSIPIPILNANRQGIAEAEAARLRARGLAEVTFEHLERELAGAIESLEATRAQRAAFESEIVPMLDEQDTEVERLAELGEVDTLLLLETVTRRFEAKSTLLALRQAEFEAAVAVATLLGPDGPTDPAPAPQDPPTDPATHDTAAAAPRAADGDQR